MSESLNENIDGIPEPTTRQLDEDRREEGPTQDVFSRGLPNDKGETVPPPSVVEWGVRIFSISLLAVIVGYLLYLCFRAEVPARFEVVPNFAAVERNGPQWMLPVNIKNTSTESVRTLTLGFEQETSDGTVSRTTTLYILGEGESANIEVHLPERPTEQNLTSHVHIYQSP